MMMRLMTLGLWALTILPRIVVAHININYPLGQWNFTEEEQEEGAFCGGGTSGSASAWLAQDPFISLSGDAGETVTVRFIYSNYNPNGTEVFEGSIDNPVDFNTTLVENVTIPDSGNLCVDTTLPELAIGAVGVLYIAAVDPQTGSNVSSCATIEYIPETLEGQLVPETNLTYREFYCSNSTDLPVAETSCDCHCHDAEPHCTGVCSDEEIEAARDQCTAEYESGGGGDEECDCHCHGEEEHCIGNCTEQQETEARNECAASATVSSATTAPTATGESGTVTATASGAAATATDVGSAASNLVSMPDQVIGFAALVLAFIFC
ncbi:uncharacterized protein Z518_11274 [Rhinocladiella mackenziei CBS 650.93]|uniref:GPI anchored protein n=1 Tax=Rhinocladiella mackenziei CBS 650.93 TaxID=1442369 RepID=A0A0D2I8K6_9EURO|nr:uncharacterized protein Z518_11274 [Rhinocladiella mackenziei CBS 650.93]KIW99535.1 hypothetical protein Z518_11274 [Rhinocladiella mackenziei CBS 650.93]